MRIECEQCNAVYTIDDKLISDRGVRAQCPRCGHQKVVQKGAAEPPAASNPFGGGGGGGGAANPFGGGGGGAANPFGGGGGAANPFGGGGGGATNPFGGGGTAPAQATPMADPFGAATQPDPFGGQSTAPGFGQMDQPSDPFGGPPSGPAPASDPFAAGGASQNPFAGSGATNPFGAGGAPASDPFAQASGGGATAPGPDPFGGASAPGPAADPFGGASAGGGDPFAAGGAPASGSDPFAAAPGSSPFGPAPSTDTPLSGPPTAASGPGFGADDDPFAGIAVDGSSSGPAMPASDDPFAAVGLGDSGPSASAVADKLWRVEAPGGNSDNVPLEELREMIRAGTVGATDLAGPQGEPLKMVRDNPMLAVSLPKAQPSRGPVARPQGAGAAGGVGLGGLLKPLLVAGLVVAVGVGGYYAYQQKPNLFGSSVDSGDNPFRRALSQWTLQFPDVEGTSQEQVVEGRRYMRADTAVGYRRADEHFRKALILDPGNVDAIVGYVENYANLPGVKSKADAQGIQLVEEGIEYALKQQPEHAGLLRAKGAFALAQDHIEEAQRVLLRSQSKNPEDIDTTLLLARTHLDRDANEALRLIEQVQRKAPELKAALQVAGGAHRRLGNYKKAREFLRSRLESDPGNVPALREMARLELDLDKPQRAINALVDLTRADEQDVEARLHMAQIQYQLLGYNQKAERELRFIIDNLEKVAGRLLLPVQMHYAYLLNLRGEREEALSYAQKALAIDDTWAPALVVLARILRDQGKLDDAKKHLEQAVALLPETPQALFMPTVRTQLADVQIGLGDKTNAKRNYSKALEDDPNHMRGYLGLATAYIADGESTQAANVMRRALNSDPRYKADHRALTDFPTPTSDIVAYAKTYDKARPGSGGRALKLSGEGIVWYHADQISKAKATLQKALSLDSKNHGALLYMAVIDMDEDRYSAAARRLKKAVDSTAGSHAITHTYLAKAELRTGRLVDAEHRLGDVLDNDANSLAGRYALSQLRIRQDKKSEAEDMLRALLKEDPDYRPVKRSLAVLDS